MSDNDDNIFDDEDMIELDIEDTESSSLKKKTNKITIQSDNEDDSDYDEENEKDVDNDLDDDEAIEAIEDIVDVIDEDDEDDEDNNDDENDEQNSDDGFSKNRKTKKINSSSGIGTELPNELNIYEDEPTVNNEIYEDDEDDENPDENYLQKFETNIKENYVSDFHPETNVQNYEEIIALTKVVRDKNNIIVDPLHKTIPVLTKYERARVLGQRTKQINKGSTPYISVPENIIDGHLIAQLELEQKRIPFIIRRPLPGGSGSEYWCLKDLEVLTM